MKIFKNIFRIIIIVVFIFIVARIFSGNEDTWICQNGDWIKHGNPSSEKPLVRCFIDIKIYNSTIHAEVSKTKSEMSLGLSGRTSLASSSGMIFMFEKAGNYGFWMKDMNFPIDILWIDDNFEIVGIEKSLLPSTYPDSFGEKYFAKYVLEVSAGYCDKNNIKVGDKIIFSNN